MADGVEKVLALVAMGLSHFRSNDVIPYCQGRSVDVTQHERSPYALSFAAAIVLSRRVPVTVTRAPTLMFFLVPITQWVIES